MSDQSSECVELDESKDTLLNRKRRPGTNTLALSFALNAVLCVALVASLRSHSTVPARAVVEAAARSSQERVSHPVVTCLPSDADTCDCSGAPIGMHTWTPPEWWKSGLASIYEASAPMAGVPTPLSRFKAKATIITNVASA